MILIGLSNEKFEEIAETKKMIKELVNYAQKMEYENVEDFANF